jgi:hypothetical protein
LPPLSTSRREKEVDEVEEDVDAVIDRVVPVVLMVRRLVVFRKLVENVYLRAFPAI